MEQQSDTLNLYRQLADRYDELGQLSMRDRFLMLAADAALQAGRADEAERLRGRLLQQSRHHMLKPYRSFAEAVAVPDVSTYLNDLRANYPPDLAQRLLETLESTTDSSLERTQSVDATPATPVPSTIPPTAPLLDPFTAPARPGRPTWQPVNPLPAQDEPAAPPQRPLAQPLPGRSLPPRPETEPGLPPVRPTMALPSMRPSLRPVPIHPVSPPEVETGSNWLSLLLSGIVIAGGLALAAFTLARPLLH